MASLAREVRVPPPGYVPSKEEPPLCSQEELQLEKEHIRKIISAFLNYKAYGLGRVNKAERNFLQLPVSHQQLLPDYLTHLAKCREAVARNYEFITTLINSALAVFENVDTSNVATVSTFVAKEAREFDMDKVKTTLKQFARDWSKEGEMERAQCYRPIIQEITDRFPSNEIDPSCVSVLVPGAGLGRLSFEIARCGYICQGNEFSMHMLLASNFILNRSGGVEGHVLYPWVLQTCNNLSRADQLAPLHIPDCHLSDLPYYGLYSMAAGDFLEVYTEANQWNCVACCFFIDTAHNVIRYLEKIYHILKPGGIWINFGPLLYHFTDMPHEFSLDLSWEEIHTVAVNIGFEVLKEDRKCPSPYIQNPRSMMQLSYNCVFFVARKPVSQPGSPS